MLSTMTYCSQSPSATEEVEQITPAETPQSAAPSPGGSGGWLEGIPEIVPPFTHGDFSTESYRVATNGRVVYSLYYEKVTMEEAREYTDLLREKGFSVNEENVPAGYFSASGSLKQGEGTIGYSFSLQDSGHVDLHLNIVEKFQ